MTRRGGNEQLIPMEFQKDVLDPVHGAVSSTNSGEVGVPVEGTSFARLGKMTIPPGFTIFVQYA